jgi:hypothetical protein
MAAGNQHHRDANRKHRTVLRQHHFSSLASTI